MRKYIRIFSVVVILFFICSIAFVFMSYAVNEGENKDEVFVFYFKPKNTLEKFKVCEEIPVQKFVAQEVQEPEEPEPWYTEEELELLSRVVYTEARGESYECKLMVASVVLNRMQSTHFADTIKGVIYQKNQFLVYKTISLDTPVDVAYPYPSNEECREAAKKVLDEGSILPPEVLVFYAKWSNEPWVNSRKTHCTEDTTVFAYLTRRK